MAALRGSLSVKIYISDTSSLKCSVIADIGCIENYEEFLDVITLCTEFDASPDYSLVSHIIE